MNVLETLKAMRDVLEKPEHWTQGMLARTKDQRKANPLDPKAYCFCLFGAMSKVQSNEKTAKEVTALLEEIVDDAVASFNDSSYTKHSDILEALDKAISACSMSQS